MSDTYLYLINSAAWSICGLIVGFFLGRAGREIHEINESLKKEDDDHDYS